jgi:hypothetical protein
MEPVGAMRCSHPDYAARAKFSGIGKPSAKSLNSKGNDAYPSSAIVVAVCEDGRPFEEVAGFLCRSGTVEEARRKAEDHYTRHPLLPISRRAHSRSSF